MNPQELEGILDKKLDSQRERYERYIGILSERIISENKASYEYLRAQMNDGFTEIHEKIDSLTEIVVTHTESISALEGHEA